MRCMIPSLIWCFSINVNVHCVYVCRLSWWQEWCHYAGVQAVYDLSQYCVVDLWDAKSSRFPTAVFAPSSSGASTVHSHRDTPVEPSVPIFRQDIVPRPGAIKNHTLQARY